MTAGNLVVVKFGGNAMVDEALKEAFAAEILELAAADTTVVVVHGGGPQIQAMLGALAIESEFRAGLRVTSSEVLAVVRMVLAGQVQRELVDLLNRDGSQAVGITGEDGVTLLCKRHQATQDGHPVDIGFVGDVVSVDVSLIHALIKDGRIPVVSSIGVDEARQAYNVNADAAAGALAAALGATDLVMMTDVPGLYSDWPSSTDVVAELTASELAELLPSLDGGMIPKMAACLEAVVGGVHVAHVVDGRQSSAVTNALAGSGIGTRVVGGGKR